MFFRINKDSQVTAVTDSLHAILSKDDKNWKIFVKFRRALGHPRPFENEGHATRVTMATGLLRCLELDTNTKDLLNQSRVALVTRHRLELVRLATSLLAEVDSDHNQGETIYFKILLAVFAEMITKFKV